MKLKTKFDYCETEDIEEVEAFGNRFFRCKRCGHSQMEYKSDVKAHLEEAYNKATL